MGGLISGTRCLDVETLGERAARAAAGLASLGIGPGDMVALYLRNDLPFFEASAAAGLLGAYPTPVNWHYTPDEAAYLFENSGAKAIVIHADLIPPIRDALPAGVPVLVVPTPPEIAEAYGIDAAPTPPGMLDWSSWLEGFEPRPPSAAEAPGTVIYTSGTTGRPKGVRRAPPSAEQAMTTAMIIGQAFGFMGHGPPGDMVTVVTGPMYHSAPNAYGLTAARLGGTVILQPRFEPEELLAMIQRHRVTHLHMVPIMFHRLLKLPEAIKAKYDLSSLRFVVHAAAPCPPPIKRAMIEWWGPVINEYYGSTEVSAVTFCTSEDWLGHPGTVGKPWPQTDLLIIDAEGQSLPTGEVGEVVVRTRGMADFTYHGDDQKRRDSEKAGLIAPGDIGYLDKDGFLYLCDRAKDMIISGGVNIYPAEIEAELLKMPGIADCAVFGIPDEEFGEGVCAVVQPSEGADVTEASVKAYLREHIAGYKMPRRVDLAAELPREDSGKIFKRKLREPFWEGLERRI
ncbi:MAG: AMP-binding protein [Alphaproteobacteria bacterium]|nr:AMP-binding protein [Alphaproteobacteria bacterium]MBU1516342.1 AMP-binding protein [Alphaproteobacteria bacterium]MBU2093421.1 AMP-binding protein [Alphaproteobacteria bacterium]MBU2153908.1 AMP-binding protein [Alphaproteobacteria bacterium]MBU2307780.1 AMP-binding protein [Alphaproteobacteria bacterium]